MTPVHRADAAKRADAIAPFLALDMLNASAARAARGAATYRLDVGEPGAGSPAAVRAAAAAALRENDIGYTEALGRPALRAAIAAFHARRYNAEIDPARVAVTTGSSAAFILAFLACFNPRGRVAVAEPGYPAYRNILRALDLVPVAMPVGAETGYALTTAHLDAAQAQGPLDGVMVASPANPTGAVQTPESLAAIAAWCDANGARLISDEIYHGVSFDAPCVSAAGMSPDAIVINSFSKYFSMTGWRVGWMIAPENLTPIVNRLAQSLYISVPTLAQRAALAAFSPEVITECDARTAIYWRNRDIVIKALRAAGVEDLAPSDGGFYVYANMSPFTDDTMALAQRMLDEIGVSATPGRDFDPARGDRYTRFSVAGDTAMITRAAELITPWLRAQRRNACAQG